MMSCTFLKFTLRASLVLLAIFLSGCGQMWDGVNYLRTIQLDPGKLYLAEFYRTATPEDVKAAIGGRSLAGKSYTVKKYSQGSHRSQSISLAYALCWFLPSSSVEKHTIYPLEIAVQNSPYPEVIALMLKAGADCPQSSHFNIHDGWQRNPEIDKIMMLHYRDRTFFKHGLIAYAGLDNREIVDFCLNLAETAPEILQDVAWTEEELLQALEAGLTLKHAEMAAYLLERGAAIPKSPERQTDLFSVALRNGNADGFWLLLEQGADYSAQRFHSLLLEDAAEGKIEDENILKLLAGSVSMDGRNGYWALRALCSIGNVSALDIVLKRSGGMPTDAEDQLMLLEVALQTKDLIFFKHLVSKGADCGAVDKWGDNDLMYTAYLRADKNAELMEYLAARVPVKDDNGRDALRYACEAGNLKAVRILLDRGAEPPARYTVRVGGNAAEAAAISALLRERGYLPE